MSADDYDTAIIDKATLDLVKEVEKIAICDVVSNLVNQEVAITSARNFWDAASTAASIRGYQRSGPEIRYIFNKCHSEGRTVPNAKRYIQDKMRVGGGKYPAKVPDYNAPDFINEDQKKRLGETAKAALALMGEGEDESKGHEMSFRDKQN